MAEPRAKSMDDRLIDITNSLAEIKTKMTHVEELSRRNSDKIDNLEKFQANATGMSRAVIVGLSLLSGILGIALAVQNLAQ